MEILRAIEALHLKLNIGIDSVEEKNSDILSEFQNLKNDFVNLSKQHKKLSEEFTDVKLELNKLNQKSLDSDIIFFGIPDYPNEILLDTVNDALRHLNIKLKPSDVISIFRMRNKKNETGFSPICLELFSRAVSGLILHAQKTQMNDRPVNDLRNVYIKPRLSRYNLDLMSEARKFQNENNMKFLWFQNSDILLRESDLSQIIKIRSEEDLLQLKAVSKNVIGSCKNFKW